MLETYFKSYFWTFQLAVIFVSGLLVARTVNAFVRGSLEIPPEHIIESTRAVRGSGEDDVERIPTGAFLERNLFQAKREDLEAERRAREEAAEAAAEAEEATSPESFDDSSCTIAGVSAKLVATVVARDPANSVAVFKTGSDEEAVALRVGDEFVDQGRVMRIEWRNVYLDRNNRCEIVSLDEDAAARRSRVVAERSPEPDDDGGDLDANVNKVGSGEYEIARAEIDNVLSNMSKLATQARIVPSFKNGKANGFKLFSIRPDSLYAKIGIKNGDIIQQINGYEINSPDKALEIYSKLKDAQTITVDLLRRGKSRTMTYNIR